MTQKKKNQVKIIKDKLYVLLCFVIIVFVIFYCFRLTIFNALLNSNLKTIEASIINQKNILGKGIITQMFTYSYQFYIDGESFTGDSRNQKYRINDTIKVGYWPYWAGINRPKN